MLHSFHLAILNLFTLQFFYKSSTNFMKKCSSLSSFFMKEDPSFFKRKISPLEDKLWNFISNLCLHPTPLLFSMPWNKIRLLKSSAKAWISSTQTKRFLKKTNIPLWEYSSRRHLIQLHLKCVMLKLDTVSSNILQKFEC